MYAGMVDDAESLRWMQSTWAGVNTIFTGSQKRDFALTRLGGCFGTQMAEAQILKSALDIIDGVLLAQRVGH